MFPQPCVSGQGTIVTLTKMPEKCQEQVYLDISKNIILFSLYTWGRMKPAYIEKWNMCNFAAPQGEEWLKLFEIFF